jgi:hypothetical protein
MRAQLRQPFPRYHWAEITIRERTGKIKTSYCYELTDPQIRELVYEDCIPGVPEYNYEEGDTMEAIPCQ